MKSKLLHCGLVGMALFAAVSVAADARAAANVPGSFYIDATLDSVFQGNTTSFTLNTANAIDTDIDASGVFSINSVTIPADLTNVYVTGPLQVSAQLILQASGNSGSISPSDGETTITLRFKLRFTWSGSPSCDTSAFNVTLSSRKTFTAGGNNISGVAYNQATGDFKAVASDFTIAALTAGCGTSANRTTLNNAFGLGASAGTVGIKLDPGFAHDQSGSTPPVTLKFF